jgi:hypothetical protein
MKVKCYALYLMRDFVIFEGRSENKFKTCILRYFASNLNSFCNFKVAEIELYGTEWKILNNLNGSVIMVLLFS